VNYSYFHVDGLRTDNLLTYNLQPQFCHVWIKKTNHRSVFFPRPYHCKQFWVFHAFTI
jgi:hypothetical protein